MIEFYGWIKWVHVAAVIASGVLFATRGALVIAGRRRLALSNPSRWASWSIDTVLLTAALMLFTLLPEGFFANGWLAAKLGLLVVYIALGALALRTASRSRRLAAYLAAIAVYAWMAGIARAHHPLGLLAAMAG